MKILSTSLMYLTLAVAVLVPTASSRALAATVPFKGALEGAYTSLPGENPTTMVASGKASHLGRFSYRFNAQVSPDATSAFGTVQFVGANGDKIFGEFSGEATLFELPLIWIEEEITITGGTGRFRGVTGHLTMIRYVDVTDGSTAGAFHGELIK
jgi:hypothetical protein